MKPEQYMARAERAWNRLQAWAQKWHRVNPSGIFAGTLGGASRTVIYFSDVRVQELELFFVHINAKVLTEGAEGEASSKFEFKTAKEFLESFRNPRIAERSLQASALTALADGSLALNIFVEQVEADTADVRLAWAPLLAFFNARDLKTRFISIFVYFFSLQEVLNVPQTALCLERAPYARRDYSQWIEI